MENLFKSTSLFTYRGHFFPPLADRARNAHKPVIGKMPKSEKSKKRDFSTTITDRTSESKERPTFQNILAFI